MQVTLKGRLHPRPDQVQHLERLMRVQSSAMRYAYNRLLEDKDRSAIVDDLMDTFELPNQRYARGAYYRAKNNLDSAKQLVKAGELEDAGKVVFGGRGNHERRQRGEITNQAWKRLRNSQVYVRGEVARHGNLNLRTQDHDDELVLRVNVAPREYIHVPLNAPHLPDAVLEGEVAYGVRIVREDDGEGYGVRVNHEEPTPDPDVLFTKGAVGVDVNRDTVDLTVTNPEGNPLHWKTIRIDAARDARRAKKQNLAGELAKQVVQYASYWERGLVVEDLNDVSRDTPQQHSFLHRLIVEAVQRRAAREGVATREENPAFTSIIGRTKYAPRYNITVHQAAALVVARRGQGYRERLRGLKTLVFDAMEARQGQEERAPARRVHAWSLWSLIGTLPQRQVAHATRPSQSPETTGVESRGPRRGTERSPPECELGGGKTPIQVGVH